jgi:tetratricopeptide (TPR) repeat protein
MSTKRRKPHSGSEPAFDVYLIHNGKDMPAVRELAEALEARGLQILLSGSLVRAEIERVISKVNSVAILVGKDGEGPWEISGVRESLSQRVDRGLPILPVLLPGAPATVRLPSILQRFTWADFRDGMTDDRLDRLVRGITGEIPVSRGASPTPSPRVHNLPFSSLGDILKGREQALRSLKEGHTTAITQAQTIHGLGGIGKTRLAVEYAWRSGSLYDYAFFVAADSTEALYSNLASLARPSVLNLPEFKTATQKETLAAVLRWLREHDRWLLILDNVDTMDAERSVVRIISSLSTGRILITSRIRDWPTTVARQQIETLSMDEAQEFLLERTATGRRARSKEDPDQALRLARELGGLPLALEQAAAYIAQHQISLSEYLEAWEKEREKVINWYDASTMRYPASVAVTWQKTFQELSPTTAAILRLAAHLSSDPIPLDMYEEKQEIIETATALLCNELGTQRDGRSVEMAVAELTSYSMATRYGRNFTIHRMVQDVLRSRIPEKRRREWIEQSLLLVFNFSPADPSDVRSWPIWDLLRPHATCVVKYADDAGIAQPTAQLMNQLAALLFSKSLYGEAEPLMRRALQIDEESLGPRDYNVIRDLNNLSALLQTTNRFGEAEPLIRRALQIQESHFRTQHPEVAINLNNLAQLLQETNRFEEAEPLMRRALQIDEGAFGPQHSNVARDLNNLAQLLQETNRLAEAEPLMRRALQIDEGAFGPQHPNVARDLNNLAQLLQETNRLTEAEPLMRRALQIDEYAFGPQHPNVARDLNNLARLLQETNRLAEAEPLMRRALQIDEGFLGPQHPNVARDLSNLAALLQETNRSAEAEPLMRRALQIDEESFGLDHPSVARDLHNLAQLLRETARLAEAEPLMRRALEINESSFGSQHTSIARDLNNLAQLLLETNRLAEAEPLIHRALQIDESALGPQHPNVARDLGNLAWLLQATNRLSEAEPLMRRALQIDEDSFGPQHPKAVRDRERLAQLLREMNRSAEAESLLGSARAEDSRSPLLSANELLLLAFRLVVARRASPDLLLHLDAARLREAVAGVLGDSSLSDPWPFNRPRAAADRLKDQFPDAAPDPLWQSWMLTTQSNNLEDLVAKLASPILPS